MLSRNRFFIDSFSLTSHLTLFCTSSAKNDFVSFILLPDRYFGHSRPHFVSYLNGNVEADFYLTYFLLIIICCIFEDPKILTAVSVFAPLVYTLLLFRSADSIHPSVFLRLPFLFVVSLFYGYFAQLIRAQRALKEEAEQKSQGKKEVLDIVSHEFRTPLNLISGYAQALKSKTLGEVTEEQEKALAKILRQSDNLLHLVNGMLDLTRIETGDLSVQKESILLPEYLREMKLNYEVILDKPLSLQWSSPPDLPTIISDKAKLTIILQNLINNAIKFTDKGSIQVSTRWRADKKALELEVADTGAGIPEEALPIIFDKFRQVDSSITRVHGGIGLGLHIVKAFTEMLGGTVAVRSELDKGSISHLPCRSRSGRHYRYRLLARSLFARQSIAT